MAKRPKHEHDWEIVSYRLSKDRLDVSIIECCEECGADRKYERPNKRLSHAGALTSI